jgi:hypothetical protein
MGRLAARALGRSPVTDTVAAVLAGMGALACLSVFAILHVWLFPYLPRRDAFRWMLAVLCLPAVGAIVWFAYSEVLRSTYREMLAGFCESFENSPP